MKKILKRMFLLLALVLAAGMVPHFAVEASAATSAKVRTLTLQLDEGYCPTHKSKGAKEVKSIAIDNVEFGYTDNGYQQVTIHFSYTVNCDNCGKDVTVSDWISYYNSSLCNSGWNNKQIKSYTSDNKKVTVKVSRPATHFVNSWTSDGTYHSGSCGFCGNVKDMCFGKHPTCVSRGLCSTCGNEYGSIETNPNDHKWGKWQSNGDYKHHSRTCTLSADHTESGICYGGTASCDSYAVCQLCGGDYGTKLDHNYTYAFNGATITETCDKGCGHDLTATLQLKSGMSLGYTGYAVEPCEIVYPVGWVGEQVQPTSAHYKDNVNVGEAACTVPYGDGSVTCGFDVQARSLYDIDFNMARNFTYDGTPKKPPVTVGLKNSDITLVEGEDYTLTYVQFKTLKEGIPYSYIENSAFTEAGNYAVFIKDGPSNILSTSDDSQSVYQTYTIGKAQPAVTAPVAKENLVYSGNAHELITPGSAQGGTMYYSLGTEEGPGGTSLESIPTGKDAGTYYVWYQVMGDANHNNTNYDRVEVTIRKAKPTVSLPKANTLTYDGTAQELITAGSVAEGQGTMQYALISIGADGRPDVSDPVYSAEIPTAVDAGVYFVSTQVEGNENYASVGYPLIVVTIDEAEASSFPPPYNANDLTYNGTDHALAVVSGTIPYPGHFEFALSEDASEAPESGWSETIPTGKDAGDYFVWWRFVADKNYKDTEPAVFLKTIAPKSIESGEADIECPSLTWNGAEQDAALSKFTLDGLEVTYELSGNTALHVGLHDMTITGTGNFTGQRDFSFLIVPDGTLLDGLENATVTSDDSKALRKAKDMVDNANTENLTDEMKQTLTDIGTKADALRKRLNDAVDASATENVAKGVTITADNAKASDKETLQKAKTDLEAALNTYGPNYTQEEQGILNGEIDRLEDLIADIAKSEETIKAIADLPATAAPDNTAAWKKADEAQAAYNALTSQQKKIVDNSTGGKLPALLAGRYDVRLTKISTKTWYKKGTKDLVLTFNGPADKFDHLVFGGKKVDAKYVTVKSGSTVVTLKASYLVDKNITSGRTYKVSAVYNFGKDDAGKDILVESSTDTSGKAIEVVVKTAASSAATGDMFQVGLWAGIGGLSILALIALLILMKKKK